MPRLTLLGLLRAGLVLLAVLAGATVLPRTGVPARLVPDLVVILVASGAVLRGRVPGAVLGLAAGWVVDLVPPSGSPLGVTALLYAASGAVAGSFRRDGGRTALVPAAALLSAAASVQVGRVALTVLADGVTDLAAAASRVAVTLLVGALALPLLIRLDQALVRRRLA